MCGFESHLAHHKQPLLRSGYLISVGSTTSHAAGQIYGFEPHRARRLPILNSVIGDTSDGRAAAQSDDGPAPSRRDWLGLTVLSLGLAMIVLDGTIVGVSLPVIIGDLHLDLTDAQWVNSLYAVILAAILLVTGRLADRWGRRSVFVVGLIVFVLGSVLAAAATDSTTLIGARAVQAVGAGCIMPATLSTVNATFRGRYRAAAFGVWGAVISGAAAVGPLAGGALTQYASWRWIFLVNVPIGALLLIGAILVVPETTGKVVGRGADVDGALLSALGFGSLVFAVIEGPTLGWWKPLADLRVLGMDWPSTAPVSVVPVLLLISSVSLVTFWFWERHRLATHRSAILDIDLFHIPTFSWGNLTAAAVAVGEFAILFVLPLFLVNALGLDVMSAGWVLAAMAVGAFASGAMARHLAALIGSPGTVLVGLALELIGTVVIALVLSATVSAWVIAAPLVVYGLGMGLASAQLTGTVLRDVPPAESGQGSAAQSTVRQIGSALGTALSGAALSVALAHTIPSALAGAGVAGPQVGPLVEATRDSAGGVIDGLRGHAETDHVAASLSAAFADATRTSLWVTAVFLVLGVIGAIRVWVVARRE